MSVERRVTPAGSVSFVVRWRAGGKARSKSFQVSKYGNGKRAEQAAERAAGTYDKDVRQQLVETGVVVVNRGSALLRDSWHDWYVQGCETWTEETQSSYASCMDRHVLPGLGHLQLAAILPSDIEKWQRAMRRDDVGPSAVRKSVSVLGSLLSFHQADRTITTNPARAARKPPAPRKRTPVKISPEQVETLIAWLRWGGMHGDAMLVSLLAYSGMRPESEAIVFDWIDFGSKTLTVHPSRKRGAKLRHVTLLEPLADDAKEWRRRSGRIGGLMVPFGAGGVSGFGDAWSGQDWDSWRRNRWEPAVAAVGLPPHTIPRDLRGSFASLLIWEGRSIVDVARQLGHSPSVCLDVYAGEFAEFDPVDRRPAVEVIQEARIIVAANDHAWGEQRLARAVQAGKAIPVRHGRGRRM